MMKRSLYIFVGILLGAILGYFLLFSGLHLVSLYMVSDDNLNQAGKILVIVWFLPIILTGWLANGLYTHLFNRSGLSKLKQGFFVFLGMMIGIVVADLVLALSLTAYDWNDTITRESKRFIVLTVWLIFSLFMGWITHSLVNSFLIKRE